jgi:molybdate transport system permease protein
MTPDLWPTIRLSLVIASRATILALLIALPLAYLHARRRYLGKSLIESLIIVPMVLPPTVMGYLIIIALGRRSPVGQFLNRWFDFSIMFTLSGAVLAAAIVALPLLYLPTRAAFAAIDRDLEDMARVEGANRLQVFWHVSLPMSLRGVTSGVMLAFARALGEFGATVMVFGIRENRATLPISIYIDYESGDMARAFPAVALLCILSLIITLLYNRSALSRQI